MNTHEAIHHCAIVPLVPLVHRFILGLATEAIISSQPTVPVTACDWGQRRKVLSQYFNRFLRYIYIYVYIYTCVYAFGVCLPVFIFAPLISLETSLDVPPPGKLHPLEKESIDRAHCFFAIQRFSSSQCTLSLVLSRILHSVDRVRCNVLWKVKEKKRRRRNKVDCSTLHLNISE